MIQANTLQIILQYLKKLCHTLPYTKIACANTLYCLFRFYKQNANLNLFCFNKLINFDISTSNIIPNAIAFIRILKSQTLEHTPILLSKRHIFTNNSQDRHHINLIFILTQIAILILRLNKMMPSLTIHV